MNLVVSCQRAIEETNVLLYHAIRHLEEAPDIAQKQLWTIRIIQLKSEYTQLQADLNSAYIIQGMTDQSKISLN